jgi:hypothetical protein
VGYRTPARPEDLELEEAKEIMAFAAEMARTRRRTRLRLAIAALSSAAVVGVAVGAPAKHVLRFHREHAKSCTSDGACASDEACVFSDAENAICARRCSVYPMHGVNDCLPGFACRSAPVGECHLCRMSTQVCVPETRASLRSE